MSDLTPARAARYYGVGDVRLEDIVVPSPGPGEVLIEVAYAGICGSDLHEYFSAQTVTPTAPHPLTGVSLPVVLGHEFSGTIVATGPGADRRVGDRVAVRPTYSCGTCPSCRRGFPNTCVDLAFHGLSGPGGGLSTYTVLPASMTFVLPDEVSLLQGAVVEPMAVSYHGVSRVVSASTRVAYVGGAGPIGIGAVFALRELGVERIYVGDPSPYRRAVASSLGVTRVFDPSVVDLPDVLGSEVLDVAVEAAGVAAVVTGAIAALGPRGRLVLLGIHEKPMPFEPISLLFREVEVYGSSTYTDADYDAVIAAMAAGGYDATGWTEIRPFAQLHASFDALRAGGTAKILIDVGGAR